jgi:hypothetical protein
VHFTTNAALHYIEEGHCLYYSHRLKVDGTKNFGNEMDFITSFLQVEKHGGLDVGRAWPVQSQLLKVRSNQY